MLTLAGQTLAFTTPWLLLGLLALPILWLLLRAVPPAPVRRLFPGVVLLLGLADDDNQTDRTPWWLLALRMLALAALIVGFAGPVLNPRAERPVGSGPLLVLLDGSWADARDWPRRLERVGAALDQAAAAGRTVAVATLTDLPAGDLPLQSAESWRSRLAGLTPRPWQADPETVLAWAAALPAGLDTLWLSDGVAWAGRARLLDRLAALGQVRVFESPRPVFGLRPGVLRDGKLVLEALRARPGPAVSLSLVARGPDPGGTDRVLLRAPVDFAAGETRAELALNLPAELRNRVTRFALEGQRSAGAVSLADDGLRRREVALVEPQAGREGLRLLDQTHYLRQALLPSADLIEGTLGDIVLANPDVIVLADVARLSPAETDSVLAWVRDGGLLLRFAGPRLAASDVSRGSEDALMPVRLRAGGRTIGGAMSWGEPKKLRPFGPASPFAGLTIPDDVSVSAQVLAEPDPTLSARVIASLADGTPLVTRKRLGAGQVVLFHVTANAEWSTLPLSGLFVRMLERLAVSSAVGAPSVEDLAGTTWVPERELDAFGVLRDAGARAGVKGETLAEAPVGPGLVPGLYRGDDRLIARNVITAETDLAASRWPASVRVEGLSTARETPLMATFLTLALALLAVDILASLWLSGRLRGARAGRTAAVLGAALLAGALIAIAPAPLRAQQGGTGADGAGAPGPRAITDAVTGAAQAATNRDPGAEALALEATSQLVLAHVLTGNARVDQVAEAGLRGLSDTLYARTSVEPANPIGVDLERDELAFFPFLYWPVTPDQPLPSAAAYARLNRFLRGGGMILFDTRDADVAGFGVASPNGRKLQQLALPLDIPPLEPVPSDHVLTRTFYLLQDFPGRFKGRDVWVEAAPPDAERVDGMPFRNLNDNVSPVVIGGNDWAAAWAVDELGNYLFPVGRGRAGEKQREIAYRFGVNLIMYVLTGNYKSDQVHVPALLERLGQ